MERRVGFWNVAGLGNKDREFWEGIKEWDVIILAGRKGVGEMAVEISEKL